MTKRFIVFLCLTQATLLWPAGSRSQPDFNSAWMAAGITFFHDIKQAQVYYYLPGDLKIGEKENGGPDLSFILMRYAGSATYHDEGQTPHFRNILTLRLVMKDLNADSMRKARQELQQRHPVVLLRPLPISRIEALVVFTPIGAPDTARVVERGEMAAENTAGYTTNSTYWQERYFTLFPDNYSANLLLEAFNKNLTVVSFMYAFYSRGVTDKKALDMSGYGALNSSLQKQLQAALADSASGDSTRECIVKSDAF